MAERLTQTEIQTRLAALQQQAADDTQTPYHHIRPLTTAADDLLDVLNNVEGRYMLGLPSIDVLTRGFGPKELAVIAGFAHSGKTQLVLNSILNNRDRRILFISLDDPAEMVLTKLVCMADGISGEQLERQIHEDSDATRKALVHHAEVTFRNLLVLDTSLGLAQIDESIIEAQDFWGGQEPEAVIIDYLQLLPLDAEEGGYEGTRAKSQAVKRWIKNLPCAVVVVHQANRSAGGPGEPGSLTSLSYGGEQESTFIVYTYRKRDNESLDDKERERHATTITIQVIKNKRPPGRRTEGDGHDFVIDDSSGLIRPFTPHDRLAASVGAQSVARDIADRKAVEGVRLPYADD